MNELLKAASVEKQMITDGDMALINAQAKTPLTPEQIYTFAVRLCDNQVDRDFERFPRKSLERLAELFVGKSGIFDHCWTAAGQTARLYKAEVVDEPGQKTKAGDALSWLKGYAYMVRTESNQDLIAEIEGGIKREVSVGCSVSRVVCSICGEEGLRCGHRKGEVYDGKLCFFSLDEPLDAYEWSFVAVPAQPAAGVVKSKRYGGQEEPQEPPADAGEEDTLRMAQAMQEQETLRYGGIAQ